MTILRRSVLLLLLLPLSLFAQSADQEVVSVVDAPDPVTPGSALSYTVTIRNNGPDAATNGGVNINLPLAVTRTGEVVPAGWTCSWSGHNGSCITPSFAAGATEVITINTTVGAHLANFADQSISATFFPSGTTPDPNSANNSKTATTQVDSPQVDLSVVAGDSPDPVAPDGNVTYTVQVTNGGPDTASSVNFTVAPESRLRFVSATVPAGWSCTLPSVGAVNATFTCSRATWAPATDTFTVVFSASADMFGINDTTFHSNFSINSGASNETDTTDNSVTATTAYAAPDADITVAVTDSPDPVNPDGNITYTVTVGNSGPDTAPNVTLSSFGGNNLRFQSATVPAGWSCTLPPPGTQTTSLSCTLPSLASGGSSVLTFVMQADNDIIGMADTTILFGFSANSSIRDPDPADNSETESTAYVTPDADLSITATDSPDPVAPDGNITYTVTLANGGPDATAATLNVPMNGTLKFTSITTPAGFTCTGVPAPGASASFSCTNPSFANGATAIFTIVLNADADAFGNSDQTINQFFGVTGNVSDPDHTDNGVTVSTFYDVANANVGVTATDAPDPVAAGSNLTYSGAVTNAGPDTAASVTLTIPLNSSLTFVSIAGPAGFACATPAVGATGTITCTTASLPNGASLPFTLVTQVSPTLDNGPDGVIQQDFLFGAGTNDPVPANNTLRVDTQFTTPDANIVVTNGDAPDPVAAGGTIIYSQSITNNGPDAATNATLVQSTPAGTTFQSLTAPAGWTCTTPAAGATGAIHCSKATMAASETGAFTLVVNVTGSGTIGSTVTGDSDTYDPDPTNNSASAATNVVAAASADLSVTKSTSTTTAPAGSTFPYTIVATNNGPDAASSVVLTDALPSSLLFRSITTAAGFTCTTPAFRTSGTITCNAATLASGASATFTLTVEVAQGASGAIVNGVTIGSATSDPNGGNSSTTSGGVAVAPAAADLNITKSTATTFAATGSTITYTIAVNNAGPSTATNVTVNDTLPAGLQFVSATPSQGTCNAASPVVCNLGTMLAGSNATITLVTTVTGTSGTVSNTASVTSAENAVPESSSTAPVPIGATAAANIPTLSEWMLLMLAALLAMTALLKSRA